MVIMHGTTVTRTKERKSGGSRVAAAAATAPTPEREELTVTKTTSVAASRFGRAGMGRNFLKGGGGVEHRIKEE